MEVAVRNAMISDPAVTATIFIDFPKEGDISKSEFSEKYVSVFEKEWIAIEETIKKDTTLKKLLEEKENSVILKDSSKTPLLSLLLSWIISVVSFSSMESVKLDNVLRVNTWKFYHSISFSVGPLFLVTVYNMFTKQPFAWKTCYTVPDVSTSNWYNTSSYSELCSAIVINLVIKDYPHRPGISSDSPSDTVCEGIASNIANSSYNDWALICYCIYAMLILFAFYLFEEEVVEKRYVRIALHLKGVFIPVSDQTKVVTPFKLKHPNLVRLLSIWQTWFALALAILYALTVLYIAPAKQLWYVFPTLSNQTTFMEEHDVFTNWCSALEYPVKLEYSQSSSGLDIFSFLQILLFFLTVKELKDSQTVMYDWIDTDEMMDVDNKDNCCYYDIHAFRNRTFNELMLRDWYIKYVQYPVLRDIMTQDKHKQMRERLEEETCNKFKKIIADIEEKLGPMSDASNVL